MSAQNDFDWSLEDHLRVGRTAITKIISLPSEKLHQPVCHHFSQLDPVDPMETSVTETYKPLMGTFAELGLEWLPDRLEAWETRVVDTIWLDAIIPALMHLAEHSALRYEGWSWEPSGEQPICVTDFRLIDNRANSTAS